MRSSFFASAVFTTTTLFAAEALAFAGTSLTRVAFQRQSSDVCDTSCNSFDDAVQACSDRVCLCTTPNTASLQQCITCYMTYAPSPATTAAAQNLVDTFENACSGYPLPPVTLSPSDPTGGSAIPNSATTRGTTVPTTSARPVNTPDPTPVQPTNTANFPAASAANPPTGPRFTGDAARNSLANTAMVGAYVVVLGLLIAV